MNGRTNERMNGLEPFSSRSRLLYIRQVESLLKARQVSRQEELSAIFTAEAESSISPVCHHAFPFLSDGCMRASTES